MRPGGFQVAPRAGPTRRHLPKRTRPIPLSESTRFGCFLLVFSESSKWRWNVFITDPEDVTVAGSLLGAAKSLYQKHVGKAFPEDLLRLAEGSQAERSKDRRPRRRAWASTHVRFAEALMSA